MLKKIKKCSVRCYWRWSYREGSFWESCVLAKSLNLKLIFAVENNDWSMYSSIKDRRSKINLKSLQTLLD